MSWKHEHKKKKKKEKKKEKKKKNGRGIKRKISGYWLIVGVRSTAKTTGRAC